MTKRSIDEHEFVKLQNKYRTKCRELHAIRRRIEAELKNLQFDRHKLIMQYLLDWTYASTEYLTKNKLLLHMTKIL